MIDINYSIFIVTFVVMQIIFKISYIIVYNKIVFQLKTNLICFNISQQFIELSQLQLQ